MSGFVWLVQFEKADHLLNEEFEKEEYQTREAKFIYGKNEYKFLRKLKKQITQHENEFGLLVSEANEILEEAAEHTFVDSITIFDDEIDHMYDQDFIIDKITPIITNYLVSYDI